MKKFSLFLALLLSSSIASNASHLMGGQITAEHIGADSVLVKLTIYRDTAGIPVATNEIFRIYDNATCNGTYVLVDFNYDGFSYLGNGVEEYNFSRILAPDTNQSFYIADSAVADYYIKWSSCCRNFAISNLTNPGGESMVLQTHYHTFGTGTVNSTPIFLNQPVTAALINQPWQYNPLPYDADADSLVWYLDTPWRQCNQVCAGYTFPSAAASNPFSIDPATGQITWTPDMLGNWNATVMVDEYRNGQHIGFIRRDMQILVLDSASFGTGTNANLIIGGTPVQTSQQYSYTIPAMQEFTMHISATDVDGDNLQILMNGEPFILADNPASFSTTNGAGVASASLSWTPKIDQIRNETYNMAIRFFESSSSSLFSSIQDVTVILKVEAPTAVKNLDDATTLSVGPNPANERANIVFESEVSEPVMIQLVDVTGRVCQTMQIDARTGTNSVFIPTLNMQNGFYMIRMRGASQSAVAKLVVQH